MKIIQLQGSYINWCVTSFIFVLTGISFFHGSVHLKGWVLLGPSRTQGIIIQICAFRALVKMQNLFHNLKVVNNVFTCFSLATNLSWLVFKYKIKVNYLHDLLDSLSACRCGVYKACAVTDWCFYFCHIGKYEWAWNGFLTEKLVTYVIM